MTLSPSIPDPIINPLFVGRYTRLSYTLQDITLSELYRLQTRDAFMALFSLQDQFIASICWDKVVQPVMTAYYACQRQLSILEQLQNELAASQSTFAAQARNTPCNANEDSLRNIRRQETRIAEETGEFNRLCAVLTRFMQPQQQQQNNVNVISHIQANPNNCTN